MTPPVRIDPLVLHIRGYAEGIEISKHLCEMTADYQYHCVATVNDNGEARLMGLTEGITLKDYAELKAKLKPFGVKRVSWRHNGRERRLELVNGA